MSNTPSTTTPVPICFSGLVPKDLNLTSVTAINSQLQRTRVACEASARLTTNNITANDVVTENLDVSNLLLLPPIPAGMFTLAGTQAVAAAGTWELVNLALAEVVSSPSVTFAGAAVSVGQEGTYLVSLNLQSFVSAGTASVGISVDGADPTFALISGITTTDATINNTTELYLSAGQTVQLAVMSAGTPTLTVTFGRLTLAQISAP